MAKRPIILLPDPVLRLVAAPVASVDDEVRQLADDMLETMYDAPGLGLAAPQVGVSRRLFVMDMSEKDEEKKPYVMINPIIVQRSEELKIVAAAETPVEATVVGRGIAHQPPGRAASLRHRQSGDRDFPAVGPGQVAENVDQCGLAGAVGPQQCGHAARLKLERDISKRGCH